MSFIRAKTGQRALFVVSVLVFTALSLVIFRAETEKEWIGFQREFNEIYEAKLLEKIDDPAISADPLAREKWEKQLREMKASKPHLHRVFLPDAHVRDLCESCHLGINNPLFADEKEPFKAHPGDMLSLHPPEKFGCTICHRGQGVGTSTHSAHGFEESWYDPILPEEYIEATCIGCHDASFGLEGAEKFEAGRMVFGKYGCYGCHSSSGFEVMPKFAPPFEGLKKKTGDDRWMMSWIRDPEKMRPTTLMPTFILNDEEIRDLTAFTLSLDTEKETPTADLASASAKDGEALFTELGCKACHSAVKEDDTLTRRVPNLADTGNKLSPDWVFEYLAGPVAYNPDTRMPTLDITEEDRANLTSYLMTLKASSELTESETFTAEDASVENGQKLAQAHGCYGCHGAEPFDKAPLPGVEVSEVAHKEMDELPFGYSDIEQTKWNWIYNKIKDPKLYETEDTPLKMPKYRYEEGELEDLTVYYLFNDKLHVASNYMSNSPEPRLKAMDGEWIVNERNCRGCHMFEEDVKPRIDEFIGLKTYVPPRLVGQGEKVQPQWAFQYLDNPTSMRPWLKMRMPDFSLTYEQVQTLIDYFSVTAPSIENSRVPYVYLPQRADIPQIEIDMGEYRVVSDKCMQCHPISLDEELPEDVALEDLSINLMLSRTRLRPEWIKNFLRDPDMYAGTGTKMPYVFYSPDGAARVSDPEMWISYITNYLMIMEDVPQALPEEEEAPEEEIDFLDY